MSQLIENKGRRPILIAKKCGALAPAFAGTNFVILREAGKCVFWCVSYAKP